MSHRWRLYRSKSDQKHNKASIAKDEVALLAERLEFFVPRFSDTFTLLDVILYCAGLALFIVGLKATCQLSGLSIINLHQDLYWFTLIKFYTLHFFSIVFTALPALVLIDLQRDQLLKKSISASCIRIIGTVMLPGAFAIIIVLLIAMALDIYTLTLKNIFFELVLFEAFIILSTVVILIYYWRNYKTLQSLHLSFEQKLNRLNDHIQARLAPHFLFNTLNTLSSLIETDREDANDMLQHVSYLMRTTFDEPYESSMEEEIKICRHYLAIEGYRLQDKLVVHWDLPDEDIISDMSITSLTLQTVLEQTVLHVVEATTTPVHVHIKLKWKNHVVNVEVTATTSKNIAVDHGDVENTINFNVQEEYLKEHFGELSSMSMRCESHKVISNIRYKLHDALIT